MHRYSGIDFLMKMDFEDVREMYLKAKKEIVEERLWERWLIDYANKMDEKHFTSYEEYKKEVFKTVTPKNPETVKERIAKNIASAEKIKALDQRG